MINIVDSVYENRPDLIGGPRNKVNLSRALTVVQDVMMKLVFYLGVPAIAIWALLRLPAWQRTSSDWIRFGLDAGVVLVTSSVSVWHFSLREHVRRLRQRERGDRRSLSCADGFG